MEQEQSVPNGLILARNIIAAVGTLMLLLGVLLQAADGAWRVPLWISGICLVVAAGFALATTRWKTMPVGAKVVIVIAMSALLLVVIDLIN